MLPKPLQKLYDKASLFLDKDSAHQDHYWAVGIHKAIHQAFPDFGGTHAATTVGKNPGTKAVSSCQVSPNDFSYRTRNHKCDTPGRCSVADIARDEPINALPLSPPDEVEAA
jgi:hypothetical protein